MDDNAQASAEFILLFGGIFVVVLMAIYMYNNYINDLSGQIQSKEVNEFNNQLMNLKTYFK
ncbi:class III signal peptide-containing protein [Methanobrevibacter sp.]|uniref:class III signal peptide-containing protein n=1 Tax=Methanobrevibacter sp. TaxID=66852 RepID=UPI0026DF282F|nr:class III signal peptide-containing protein [Methanobrevibacter sp.]MDO5822984.1 class III signal peptide-containing protein [Methanobrevibacter sp.]